MNYQKYIDKVVNRLTGELSKYFASINPDFDPKKFREMVEGDVFINCSRCKGRHLSGEVCEMVEGEKKRDTFFLPRQ